MASRDYTKHSVSIAEPSSSSLGDEWFNPSNNKLYKRLAVNGNTVVWQEVPANTVVTAAAPVSSGPTNITISNKTTAYTVIASDLGTVINCTSGTFTVSLTAAAALGAGFSVTIWNTSSNPANNITVDPNGAETIDGAQSIVLRAGEGTQIVCDGTNWQTGNKKSMRAYAENMVSYTTPIASGDQSLAIGSGAQANGTYGLAIGASSSATNTFSIAIGASNSSSGSQSIALGVGVAAAANHAVAIGKNSSNAGSQAVTGTAAMALGGSYASGADSFAAAVLDNTSSYGAINTSAIAIGYRARAAGTYSAAIGANASASGQHSLVLGGGQFGGGSASGQNSVVLGMNHSLSNPGAAGPGSMSLHDGSQTSAAAVNSVAVQGGSTTIRGQYAFAGGESGATAQTSTFVLKKQTTDATPTVLVTNRIIEVTSPGTANQIILRDSSAVAFTGIIVARRKASEGTQSAAWRVEGLIRREANAAATVLVSSVVNTISNVPGWTIALTADTTNGGLAVTATGGAAASIYWAATMQTSEVVHF